MMIKKRTYKERGYQSDTAAVPLDPVPSPMTPRKRKAPTDKARLNWLTRRGFQLKRGLFSWGRGWVLRFMGPMVGITSMVREAVSPRDAIDCAMRRDREVQQRNRKAYRAAMRHKGDKP